MPVKFSGFFPGVRAYFNGENPSNKGQWDAGMLFRFFIADKFGMPVFEENTPRRQEWIRAYVADGNKAAVKAKALEELLMNPDSSYRADYAIFRRDVQIESRTEAVKSWVDNLVKTEFKSPHLDNLISGILQIAYPEVLDQGEKNLSPRIQKHVNWDARQQVSRKAILIKRLREYCIEGVLSRNISRRESPRLSAEFELNETAMSLVKQLEKEDEKIRIAKSLEKDAEKMQISYHITSNNMLGDHKNLLKNYQQCVNEINKMHHNYTLYPHLRYKQLNLVVIAILQQSRPLIFPQMQEIKRIGEIYEKAADDFTQEEINSLEKRDQAIVSQYNQVKRSIEQYLIERVQSENEIAPYAYPGTTYAEYRAKYAKENEKWSIPTMSNVIGPRFLHPFYLLEAICGGIARGICAGINALCGADSVIGKVFKGIFAGPFIVAEMISYGFAKLTSRSGWTEIAEALSPNLPQKKYKHQRKRSQSHGILPGFLPDHKHTHRAVVELMPPGSGRKQAGEFRHRPVSGRLPHRQDRLAQTAVPEFKGSPALCPQEIPPRPLQRRAW